MWKSRSDEKPGTPAPQASGSSTPAYVPPKEIPAIGIPKMSESYRSNEVAHIGKSVVVRGELSGSEDLYVDGEVEGSIELHDHSLVVGPNGRIRANVHAKDITIHGKVDGNLHGTDRVELKKSAVLVGDIKTQRIVIEEGAYFKGGIDIQKDTVKAEKEKAMAAAASPSYSSSSYSSGSPSSSSSAQASMAEHKKY